MKIIFFHQYFNTPQMSGSTRSYEMARRLVDLGHEVHLVTSLRDFGAEANGWVQTNEAGIFVHWYHTPYSNSMGYARRMAAFFQFALAALFKGVKLRGDLVFATSTPLTIAIPAVLTSKLKRLPLVFEVRDLWPQMPIAVGALRNPFLKKAAKWLERWAYFNSKAVVALSPGMKHGVMETGYPEEKIAVIPNGSDNVEFAFDVDAGVKFRDQRSWISARPLVVYTGAFGKINGVEYLIYVAAELLKLGSDVRFLVIGDGAEYNMLVDLAKAFGVYEVNLYFEAPISKNEMPALLSAATLATNLVIDLPEARANSANKFFDALAAGKPILLNHGGWMHDLVCAHKCGLAMWGLSAAKVAVELDSKLHDHEWLNSAGKQARLLAEQYFDRDDLAKQFGLILESIKNDESVPVSHLAPGIYS